MNTVKEDMDVVISENPPFLVLCADDSEPNIFKKDKEQVVK